MFHEVFRSQKEEHDLEISKIEGTVPRELSGTLYRVGPGILQVGKDPLNFFDAHGMLASMTFGDGKIRFRNRHVKTETYQKEIASGKQVVRRAFTNIPSGRLANFFKVKIPSTAVHDVYLWGGRLFSAADPGHYAHDKDTLETIGEDRWQGAAAKSNLMCPMPRPDPESGTLVCYSVKPGALSPDKITFLELDQSLRTIRESTHPLARTATFVHDVAFTKNHYLVFELPPVLKVGAAISGKGTLFDAFEWPSGEGAAALIAPRSGIGPAVRIKLGPEFVALFHVINAYEDSGKIVADTVTYSSPVDFHWFAPPDLRAKMGQPKLIKGAALMRFVLDPTKGTLLSVQRIGDRVGELPEIHPAHHGKRYRYAYLATPIRSRTDVDPLAFLWFEGLMKLDVNGGTSITWDAGPNRFVSQPVMAPKPSARSEDDGWILSWVLDAESQKTEVVILDAKDMTKVARIELAIRLPAASHCLFAPAS
jgi:all-trans-8'-apo-beta-carotenal 15,15'-oxygenase